MFPFKFLGFVALVYTTILLTISFFVLFTIRKIDSKNLKFFGYMIVVLLWISAAFVFFGGLYISSTSFCRPLPPMMGNQMPAQIPQGGMMGR
jgi:hypothetical protein